MDVTLTQQFDEPTTKRRLRHAFFVLNLPTYLAYAIVSAGFAVLATLPLPELASWICLGLAVVYVVCLLLWFPRVWRVYREIWRKTGAFEHPTAIRLTDEWKEVRCGENFAKNEYRVYSAYLECREIIILVQQKVVAAFFDKADLADGGAELMRRFDAAGVKRIRQWSLRRWWKPIVELAIFIALLIIVVRPGVVRLGADETYRFPANAAAQMRKSMACRGTMLMIPVVDPGWPEKSGREVVLETPVEIAFPFERLPKLTGHQYGLGEYAWDVGSKGLLIFFLVTGSDGSLYAMYPPIAPFSEDRDIRFRKAAVSLEWQAAFMSPAMQDPKSAGSGVWKSGMPYRWRDPETALPILKKFWIAHPLSVTAKEGKWEPVRIPCFTPNLYCERKEHPMPRFTAKEVLRLHPVKGKAADEDYDETLLAFPNGKRASHIAGMQRELLALWSTGQYRVVAYDRRAETDIDDPERDNPWAPNLRSWAADMGIPLVILYGEDKSAPPCPGLPPEVRQYWQCPQCAKDEMK